MKALVYDGRLRLQEDEPRPVPAAGEALIRVLMAGICNTDREIIQGYMGFAGIPGHEFVGVVVEAGPGSAGLAGRRVVGEINCGCGSCAYCLRGLARHCPSRTVLGISGRNGCFAEFVTLPVENLRAVPDRVSDEAAVFCEPLAAAFEVMEQVHVRPGVRVLVLGDGKLGQLAARVLASVSARVTLAGRHAIKLAAAAAVGVDAVRSDGLKDGDFDIVVEATGRAEGRRQAVSLVKPRGTLVLKSTLAEAETWDWTPVVVNEITVVGSRCGCFEPALAALAESRIEVESLVSGVYPLKEGLEAFACAGRSESLKILLDMR
jgi:threonine dehydrogenase-like Zn-dependent dehydrogenase